MTEEQKLLSITATELLARAATMKKDGYRLVQIGCTKLTDLIEVNYSFDKNHEFVNLKVSLPLTNDGLPSISKIYWNAFLYENESHDLFGVTFKDMVLDYKGHFYRTSQKAPFSQALVKPQPAPAEKKTPEPPSV